jgi:hypothetical protein
MPAQVNRAAEKVTTMASLLVGALTLAAVSLAFPAGARPKDPFGACLAHCSTIKDPRSAHECQQYCVAVFTGASRNAPSARRKAEPITAKPARTRALHR